MAGATKQISKFSHLAAYGERLVRLGALLEELPIHAARVAPI